MRGWRRLVLSTAACAALAACGGQSRLDPNASVTISGVALSPDGQPGAGRPVSFGGGIGADDATFAVLTLGLGCAGGHCRGTVEATSTDEAGAYRFTLKGEQTQSTFGQAVSEVVSVTGARPPNAVSGPVTSARFKVQTTQVRLPALRLVDPQLELSERGGVAAT